MWKLLLVFDLLQHGLEIGLKIIRKEQKNRGNFGGNNFLKTYFYALFQLVVEKT